MRQKRDLDIETCFIEGVVRRDPDYVEALQILGDNYSRRGRYREGLKVDQRLRDLCPTDANVCYNLACSYSLAKHPEQAIESLNQALDLGYRDFRWIRRDPDLKPIRKHPLYRQIRERLRLLEI